MTGEARSPNKFRVSVQGNSMSPLIEDRDTIIAESLRHREPRRGAIIVFRDGESLIVHRIIRKRADDGHSLLCQMGDNSSTYSWVGEKAVLGEVMAVEKRGKVIPLQGPMARSAGMGLRMVGLVFIESATFLDGVQRSLCNERPGRILRGIRRLTATAHHLACRSISMSFLWTRRKADRP